MSPFRSYSMIRSPEDAATFRRWCRAVCAFYAAVILVLAAVSGAFQFVRRGAIEIAGSPQPASAAATASARSASP
jgi:hypothetical protein